MNPNFTAPNRRDFVKTGASLAAMGSAPGAVLAAMAPNEKFDLLVRNCNVVDAAQGLSGKRDIGIRFGRIEAIETSIAPERAQRVMDVAGKLVTPGLIDLHCHTYPYGSAIGIPADELIAHQCTTTVVSAGDGGANNFAAFRRFIVPASRTRQFAFMHIAVSGLSGFPVPELFNIDYAQVDSAARAVADSDAPRAAAYALPFKNHFRDVWLRHGGFWPDRHVRLYRRESCRYDLARPVHEKLLVDGETRRLDAPVLHFTYGSLAHCLEKMERYGERAARALHAGGRRAGAFDVMARPLWRLVRGYLLRGGFLDGAAGAAMAWARAYEAYARYARLWELSRFADAGKDALRP